MVETFNSAEIITLQWFIGGIIVSLRKFDSSNTTLAKLEPYERRARRNRVADKW